MAESISPGADENGACTGGIVIFSYPTMTMVEVETVRLKPPMPSIPDLLSFRETPVLRAAFDRLRIMPDLLFVDGHERAHPRRFGLASPAGLLLDMPTIGWAKSILIERHASLEKPVGSMSPVIRKGDVIGLAIRTQTGRTPICVSIGHKMDLEGAAQWVMACRGKCRVPKPTRQAHLSVSARHKMN